MARKILFYTYAFNHGGAEIVFGRLAHAFADAGDNVVFVADLPGPLPVHDRPNLRHVLLGGPHMQATRRLAALLRTEKPDASFSALGAQNLHHLAAALWTGRQDRCVLGYHGFAAAETQLLSRIAFWVTGLTTRLAARTICVSDALLENVRRQWHGSARRTLRIYNPVAPTEDTTPRAPDLPALIVGCGRLVPGKRFTDLVAALARVRPADTRLAILGEGAERAKIEATIASLGLADRVDLPGHVADPSAWYRRAACLAITSDSESFGLTAAEALAHGLPVVTTACGGPSEILEHGRYGRIVPIGDIEAMAVALTSTIAAPGDDALRRAHAYAFAITTIQQAYADLIDSLPKDGRRAPNAKVS